MTSSALQEWQSVRATRINCLIGAHILVGGPHGGRQQASEVLCHALVLRLASEFQGFCKAIHEEAARAVSERVTSAEPLQMAILNACTTARRLDSGNAHPDAIKQDFGRFRIEIWKALAAGSPVAVRDWMRTLDALNQARNGLAHDDGRKLVKLRDGGWPINLDTIRQWRNNLDELTVGIDRVVAAGLSRLLGEAPW